MIPHLIKSIDYLLIGTFSKYYTPNIEVKDFNVLIDGKSFFDVRIKNEEETYKKIIDMSEIMITQLIIYWTMITFQVITN